MLEQIGIFAITLVVAVAAFYAAVVTCDRFGLWRDAGLAAVIPMFACGAIAAVLCGGFTLWALN